MDHAEGAGALTTRVSRAIARTALAARVTAAMVNVPVQGIANTILAEPDGALMVDVSVVVASMVLAVVNIAATTLLQQVLRLPPLLLLLIRLRARTAAVAIATTRVALSAKSAIMDHAEVAGALTTRVSRAIARTALAARVTAAMVNVPVQGIANTILAEPDGALMVDVSVVVASMVLAG